MSTQWLFADNTLGTLALGASAGATTISVATTSGTFPSPSANQQFALAINQVASASNAENVIVTANASGSFTIAPPGLINAHQSGEPVSLVVVAAFLNSLTAPGSGIAAPLTMTVESANATKSLTTSDGPVIVTSGANSPTFTLPAAPAAPLAYYFSNVGTGTVTLDAGGSDTISTLAGALSSATIPPKSELALVYDSTLTSWVPLSQEDSGSGGDELIVHANHAGSPYTQAAGVSTYFECDTTAGAVTIDGAVTPIDGDVIRISVVAGANNVTFGSFAVVLPSDTRTFVYESSSGAWMQTGAGTTVTVPSRMAIKSVTTAHSLTNEEGPLILAGGTGSYTITMPIVDITANSGIQYAIVNVASGPVTISGVSGTPFTPYLDPSNVVTSVANITLQPGDQVWLAQEVGDNSAWIITAWHTSSPDAVEWNAIHQSYQVITSPTTLTTSSPLMTVWASNASTVTLPTAPPDGTICKFLALTDGLPLVKAGGSDKINGVSQITIPFGSFTLFYYGGGATWYMGDGAFSNWAVNMPSSLSRNNELFVGTNSAWTTIGTALEGSSLDMVQGEGYIIESGLVKAVTLYYGTLTESSAVTLAAPFNANNTHVAVSTDRSLAALSNGANLGIFQLPGWQPIHTMTVPGATYQQCAFTPDNSYLYACDSGNGVVTPVAVDSGATETNITLANASGICASPGNAVGATTTFYVATGSSSLVPITGLSTVGTAIALPGTTAHLARCCVDPSGRMVYVSDPGTTSVYSVDTFRSNAVATITEASATSLQGIAASWDGNTIYVADAGSVHVWQIDIASGTISPFATFSSDYATDLALFTASVLIDSGLGNGGVRGDYSVGRDLRIGGVATVPNIIFPPASAPSLPTKWGGMDLTGGSLNIYGPKAYGAGAAINMGPDANEILTSRLAITLNADGVTSTIQSIQNGVDSSVIEDGKGNIAAAAGYSSTVASKSANYTLTTSDSTILVTATSTMTLPDATTITGRYFTVVNYASSGVTVTVSTTASQTISGASSVTLSKPWQALTVQSNGTDWVASDNYTAAQVANALDLSDVSLQTMSGPLDVTGTMSATGQVTSAETSTTVPGFEFLSAPASAPNFGIHVGIGLDNNADLIFNVAGSGKSIKTTVGGSASNVLDNGSGIASFSHIGTAAAQTTPTITSGTAFQADASYDAHLIVPVTMTPTSVATATVAVAMGPTGTPPTLWTETVPLGVANDSFLTAIQLRVPMGWYVNLTLVNTTFTLGATANAYVIG